MNYLAFILFTVNTLISYQTGITEGDFKGKSFKATIQLDPADPSYKAKTAYLAGANIKYVFSKNDGLVHSTINSVTIDDPFNWHVDNNYLIIDRRGEGGPQMIRYAVLKEKNGYNLRTKDVNIHITPIPK